MATRSLFFILACSVLSAFASVNREQLEQRYAEHNKRYEQGLESYTMGFNDLSMLSTSEFRTSKLGYSKNMDRIGTKKHAIYAAPIGDSNTVVVNDIALDTPVDQLPTTVDWRYQTSHVTPIKNQAQCGSCWAYASTAVLEYYVNQVSGRKMTLSTEQITQCSPNPLGCGGTGGCSGATPAVAFDYVIDSHGVTDSDYMPYESGTNITCVNDDPSTEKFTCAESFTGIYANTGEQSTRMFATLSNYTILPTNDYVTMMNAVAKIGPIAISIDAGSGANPNDPTADTFKSYTGGVYTGCDWKYNTNATDLNHLMVLEGYGTDPDHGDYWLIRNSWRSNWGEGGYMRLARSASDGDSCDMDVTPEDGDACTGGPNPDLSPQKVCGPCGMLFQGVIPTGVSYLNAGESTALYFDPALTSASDDDDDDDDDDNKKDLYFALMLTFAGLFVMASGAFLYTLKSKAGYDESGSSLRNPLN